MKYQQNSRFSKRTPAAFVVLVLLVPVIISCLGGWWMAHNDSTGWQPVRAVITTRGSNPSKGDQARTSTHVRLEGGKQATLDLPWWWQPGKRLTVWQRGGQLTSRSPVFNYGTLGTALVWGLLGSLLVGLLYMKAYVRRTSGSSPQARLPLPAK